MRLVGTTRWNQAAPSTVERSAQIQQDWQGASRSKFSKKIDSIRTQARILWRQSSHTLSTRNMKRCVRPDSFTSTTASTTLAFRATRRLLQSGRCFAAHDTCCFMRHGCRFHCADPWPSASKLSGFPEAIDALGRGLRRVNSPRSVSLSGSSTRSALHTFSFCCALTPRLVLLQFGLSIRCLSNEYMRQIDHTPPRLSLPGDAA